MVLLLWFLGSVAIAWAIWNGRNFLKGKALSLYSNPWLLCSLVGGTIVLLRAMSLQVAVIWLSATLFLGFVIYWLPLPFNRRKEIFQSLVFAACVVTGWITSSHSISGLSLLGIAGLLGLLVKKRGVKIPSHLAGVAKKAKVVSHLGSLFGGLPWGKWWQSGVKLLLFILLWACIFLAPLVVATNMQYPHGGASPTAPTQPQQQQLPGCSQLSNSPFCN